MVKLNTNTSTNQTNTKLNTNQNPSKKIFVEVGKLILNLFEHGKGKEYPTEEQIQKIYSTNYQDLLYSYIIYDGVRLAKKKKAMETKQRAHKQIYANGTT